MGVTVMIQGLNLIPKAWSLLDNIKMKNFAMWKGLLGQKY